MTESSVIHGVQETVLKYLLEFIILYKLSWDIVWSFNLKIQMFVTVFLFLFSLYCWIIFFFQKYQWQALFSLSSIFFTIMKMSWCLYIFCIVFHSVYVSDISSSLFPLYLLFIFFISIFIFSWTLLALFSPPSMVICCLLWTLLSLNSFF